jgi:hypothetical protein
MGFGPPDDAPTLREIEDDEREHWRQLASELQAENQRLEQWIDDLQAGKYINCVYCGHRYGPEDEVPATMAEVLKKHIEQCPKHPMSRLKQEHERLREDVGELMNGLELLLAGARAALKTEK